jgi:hypothetical protein
VAESQTEWMVALRNVSRAVVWLGVSGEKWGVNVVREHCLDFDISTRVAEAFTA